MAPPTIVYQYWTEVKTKTGSLLDTINSSAVAEMGDCGHNRHGPKIGWGQCFCSGGSWVPIKHKVAWAEANLHTRWKFPRTKGPGNESSRELSFPGNESSRERKVSGTKVPHRDYSFLGTKGLGHEKSRYLHTCVRYNSLSWVEYIYSGFWPNGRPPELLNSTCFFSTSRKFPCFFFKLHTLMITFHLRLRFQIIIRSIIPTG